MSERPRRWPRYSLRTMLLAVACVAAPFAWAAVQLKWIYDRNAIIDAFTEDPRYARMSFIPLEVPPVKAPWSIRLFGETGLGLIQLGMPDDFDFVPDEEVDAVEGVVDPQLVRAFQRLYPEARIEVNNYPKNWRTLRTKGPYAPN